MILILTLPTLCSAGSSQLSGGADGRFTNTDADKNRVELEGLFLNFRHVFSDEKGDRLIVVGQLDIDNNFEDMRSYQTYLQYKGPLGRWNIRVGHYILPFGLLSDYDTERLVLQSFELLSLGIKLDTGINVLGFIGAFDYAISISQGVGRNRLADADENKLVTGRISWQGEDMRIGLSTLIGRVLVDEDSSLRDEAGSSSIYEKRLGLDIAKYVGPLVLRGELLIGEDENNTVGGGLLLAGYALSPKLEINLKYAHWQKDGNRNFIGAGFTFSMGSGLFLRLADEYQFGMENKNVVTAQIYYEFARFL